MRLIKEHWPEASSVRATQPGTGHPAAELLQCGKMEACLPSSVQKPQQRSSLVLMATRISIYCRGTHNLTSLCCREDFCAYSRTKLNPSQMKNVCPFSCMRPYVFPPGKGKRIGKKKRMQNYIPLSQLLIFSLHPILKSNDLLHSWEEKRMVVVPLSVRKKLLC